MLYSFTKLWPALGNYAKLTSGSWMKPCKSFLATKQAKNHCVGSILLQLKLLDVHKLAGALTMHGILKK